MADIQLSHLKIIGQYIELINGILLRIVAFTIQYLLSCIEQIPVVTLYHYGDTSDISTIGGKYILDPYNHSKSMAIPRIIINEQIFQFKIMNWAYIYIYI